jgi:hypothetical protein
MGFQQANSATAGSPRRGQLRLSAHFLSSSLNRALAAVSAWVV